MPRGLPRRAVLERCLSLLATGRKAFILMRRSDALPVCRGQRIPDVRDAVTGNVADQASGAALMMYLPSRPPRGHLANLAGWLRVTAAASSLPGGVEQLSHAEALATGERLHLENRSTSRGPLYSRDRVGRRITFSLRVAADQRCHRWMRRSVILGSRCRPPRQQCQSGSLPPVASRSGPVRALVH